MKIDFRPAFMKDFDGCWTVINEAREQMIKHLRESNIEELVAFSKTLSNWKVEIINSFCISKAEYNKERKNRKDWLSMYEWTIELLAQ